MRKKGKKVASKEDIAFCKDYFLNNIHINQSLLCKELKIPLHSITLICRREVPHVAIKHIATLKKYINDNTKNDI